MPASRPRPAAGLARPRGPLPSRVYWTRRLAVLGTALLLVLGVARVLGPGSDGTDSASSAEQASTASATTGDQARTTAPSAGATAGPTVSGGPDQSTDAGRAGERGSGEAARRRGRAAKRAATALPVPQGACADEDVRVVPEVPQAVGGDTITIRLLLRTVESEACWWHASPETLTMRIRSGNDEIWTSRQCPEALPDESVVVRSATDTALTVGWSGRRSDEECSQLTEWALPGFYHVEAAALAGEPSDLQFEVTAPQPAVVTRTAPAPQRSRAEQRQQRRQQQRQQRSRQGQPSQPGQ